MSEFIVQRIWYGRSPIAWLLLPLALLFALVATIRRALYKTGALRVVRVAQPVIVVGNITVGGTGKTPFVIWLAEALRARGKIPGVITRGYGGHSKIWPRDVGPNSDVTEVGDEALLLVQRTQAIVVAGPDRVRSAQRAIERGANVIISDDGLQHYRLSRDFEIAVIDDERRFGNGLRLPAGPLRQPVRRLLEVDAVIRNCRTSANTAHELLNHPLTVIMYGRIEIARSLTTGESRSLSAFAGTRVNAVAGVGNPQAFFAALSAQGLQVNSRALPDHAQIDAADLHFDDGLPILVTEKDAVKCRTFANSRVWVVPLEVHLDQAELLLETIVAQLDSRRFSAHSEKIANDI